MALIFADSQDRSSETDWYTTEDDGASVDVRHEERELQAGEDAGNDCEKEIQVGQ